MWDNTATMHYAEPIGAPTGRHDRRLLYRVVPLGLPRALREQAAADLGRNRVRACDLVRCT